MKTPSLRSSTSTSSFHSAPSSPTPSKFSPDEEAVNPPSCPFTALTNSLSQSLLSTSNAQKAHANTLFSTSHFSEAITTYDLALSSLPNYLDYEIAVLKSNIAACHLKLEDWKGAVESATSSLEALDRLLPPKKKEVEDGKREEGEVVEIDGDEEEKLRELEDSDQRKSDIERIRTKALMRRAKAKCQEGGWGALQGAEEDYKVLSLMPSLPLADKKIVHKALSTLPAQINAAKEAEMGEMMSKLKELGNGILKPFGLSTNNFNMVKDEKTGGYSMSFNQGK